MMPKSTATSLPSRVDEQVAGCMSAWKKPSRSAWRRKVWITRAAERRQVEALGLERRAVGERRAVDPFEREHVARGAVPVDRRHAEIRIVLGVLAPSRDSAAASSRRSISIVTERAQRLDHLDQAQPPRFGRIALGGARREGEGVEIGLEAPLDAGPQHLHGDSALSARSRLRRDAPARSRRPRPAARTTRRCRDSGLPSAAATAASASACGNGAILSCSDSRSRASATPTTSGRVARNWPSFT